MTMPDDPITKAASEKLHRVAVIPRDYEIVEGVLAEIRTMERELNALRQKEAKRDNLVSVDSLPTSA